MELQSQQWYTTEEETGEIKVTWRIQVQLQLFQ